MTLLSLAWRGLLYHRRSNLAILLGVAVGTAVLVGALLVGDSLRGSLRDYTLQRLGWLEHALVSHRFFRAELAQDLPAERVAPALFLHSSAGKVDSDQLLGRVSLLGVTPAMWPTSPPVDAAFWSSAEPGAVLSPALANELQLSVGDKLTLYFENVTGSPREALLGQRETKKVLSDWTISVRGIAPDASFAGRFTLAPTPTAPRTVWVPLRALQAHLLTQKELSVPLPSEPINAIFAQGAEPTLLHQAVQEKCTLGDWGLEILAPEQRFTRLDRNRDGKATLGEWKGRVPLELADQAVRNTLSQEQVHAYYEKLGYLSLESREQLLSTSLLQAVEKTAQELGWQSAPTLVYIANRLKFKEHEVPYSVLAALEPSLPAPLGPFLPKDLPTLADDEILLLDQLPIEGQGWGFPAKVGDTITLDYYPPEADSTSTERSVSLRVAGFFALTGPANDPDLTPEYPGITDKENISDWEPPPPFDRKAIDKKLKQRDKDFWKRQRATPKAYVNLATGRKLWGSRFGQATSVRLAPPAGLAKSEARLRFVETLRKHYSPAQAGFTFEPIRQQDLASSAGGTDFALLFLGFSCFLIVAALLLVGLLFRLHLERRAAEVGLLLAVGFRTNVIRRQLLVEALLLTLVGAVLGVLLAAGYAWGLLTLLRAWWPGQLDWSFLRLHVRPATLAVGFFASLLVSLGTIAWAMRLFRRSHPPTLLKGEIWADADTNTPPSPATSRGKWWAWGCVGFALVLAWLGRLTHDHEMRASAFFGGGMLLLTGLLLLVRQRLRRLQYPSPGQPALSQLSQLAARNAARNPLRSMLTLGLLAFAAFVVVAVEAFHREPEADLTRPSSGTGGFALLAEAEQPIYHDLNTAKGRAELDFPEAVESLLEQAKFTPLRRHSGDDTSCLSLQQPRKPRLLSVPTSLVQANRFTFAKSLAKDESTKANPWLLLEADPENGAIPVFADATTAQWMLHRGLGEVFEIPDGADSSLKVRLVGLLSGSVFQSELLVAEKHFLHRYPEHTGYQLVLVEAPTSIVLEVKAALSKALSRQGVEVTETASRLRAYLEVENTYLATFQMLGGLGLVLGTLGLAVVLLRNVWERRAELALLRALGYRSGIVGRLIFTENSVLLLWGLGSGAAAACLAVAPHLADSGQAPPWLRLVGWLGLVFVVGLLAGLGAVWATVRLPLVPALRRE